MYQSKLIELLGVLSKKELNRLEEFLQSPFFNKNKTILLFFEYLKPFAPSFTSEKLSKQVVYEHIYKGMPYDDLRLRHLMSDLLKLVERFLVHHRLESSNTQKYRSLTATYNDFQLYRHAKDVLQGWQRWQNKRKEQHLNYYYDQYCLEEENSITNNPDHSRTSDFNLQKRVDQLNIFYIASQLQFACFIGNTINNFDTDFDLILLEDILKVVKERNLTEIPVIAIYYYAYHMIQDKEDEASFRSFTQLFQAHMEKFPYDDVQTFYIFAKNFCIENINAGNEQYYEDIFELYKSELDFFQKREDDKILTLGNFKNIVTVGLRLKLYDWVEQFIEEYKDQISTSNASDIIDYNLAQLYFYREQYDDAIDLLFGKKYDDPFYEIDARKLLIKIYFEQEEYLVMTNAMKTLRVYVHRNKKIAKIHKDANRNFINFLNEIVKLKTKPKHKTKNGKYEEKLTALKEKIKTDDFVAERKWLMEVLN